MSEVNTHRRPWIDIKTTARACLRRMCTAHFELYDKLISTPGLGYDFNQIVNRAIAYEKARNLAMGIDEYTIHTNGCSASRDVLLDCNCGLQKLRDDLYYINDEI